MPCSTKSASDAFTMKKRDKNMSTVKITVFADPVCTWCWGSSPIFRALEYRYNGQVSINFTMTGMIEDIRTYNNRRLDIGGDIELSNRNIMKAWLEASRTHGMPVEEHKFHLFSEERRSTIPQNLAYIAASLQAIKSKECEKELQRAARLLRRIQEATALEAMHTNDFSVLAGISAIEGYNSDDFLRMMQSREVQRAYEEDRGMCRRYNIQGTPSYLIEYKKQEVLLPGFTSYDTIERNITQLTYGRVQPKTEDRRLECNKENIRRYIGLHSSLYPVEIATAFRMERISGKSALNIESFHNMPDIIEELIKEREIHITPAGNSFKIFALKEKESNTQKREKEFVGTF